MPDENPFGKLFLLEFFIDNIEIRNSSLIFGENNDGQICVSFQFFSYPVTSICEEDFTPKTRTLSKTSKINFKSGKSCLFSQNSPQISNMSDFDLKINVSQKLTNNDGESYCIPVGTAVVSLGGSFMKIMRNSTNGNNGSDSSPLFSIAQDEFVLRDELDKEIGTILAFVRLSCFGQLIITQFQLGTEKQYMFKGTDKVMFDKLPAPVENELQQRNEIYDNADDAVHLPGDTPYKDLFNYDTETTTEKDDPRNVADDEIHEDSRNEGNVNVVQSEGKGEDADNDEDEYKEYGAEVNGNSIKIRVLKKKKKKERKSKKESEENQKNECCLSNLNFCDCDVTTLPPQISYPDCSQYYCECL
ncbi:hypothetical protein LSTR_LSTR014495 [Laodelphax striatellus]|uniref:Uncharacterized protein n=1 Tax=Laodelphax striatellus TaxID=195883 RepID=A0A482XS58_LAOST|nr:hypothetical protein LSTR_LSTR014495 [Laodelphax striatellus]